MRLRSTLVPALAILAVAAPAASAQGGPPPLTAKQKSCIVKKLGAKVGKGLLRGKRKPTAVQRRKLAVCLAAGRGPAKVQPAAVVPTISASPFDLATVTEMSRFRSCAGHDYSGTNVQGARETNRSMKHYVVTSTPWESTGSVKAYSPFDGEVVAVEDEQFPLGRQLRIRAAGSPWTFTYFHVDAAVRAGDQVRAGQVVGAWPPANAGDFRDRVGPTTSFDVALTAPGPMGSTLESYLLHLAPDVERQYAAKGLTADRLVMSQAARDAAPCQAWESSSSPESYDRTADYVAATG